MSAHDPYIRSLYCRLNSLVWYNLSRLPFQVKQLVQVIASDDSVVVTLTVRPKGEPMPASSPTPWQGDLLPMLLDPLDLSIVQALGLEVMNGKQLAARLGYKDKDGQANSTLRMSLSKLANRQILIHEDDGYRCTPEFLDLAEHLGIFAAVNASSN